MVMVVGCRDSVLGLKVYPEGFVDHEVETEELEAVREGEEA